jgi:hypothetical protein
MVHDRGTPDESSFLHIEVDLEDRWTDRDLEAG